MNEKTILQLLNTGDQDTLVGLPGIGPALANRLIAERPFDSLKAVEAVNGISSNLLQRLSDMPQEPMPKLSAESESMLDAEPQIVDETPSKPRLTDIKERIEKWGPKDQRRSFWIRRDRQKSRTSCPSDHGKAAPKI